jgi:hypothetical protein
MASQKTLRRQSLQLETVGEVISGGSPAEKMDAEVKSLPKDRREELLREASLPLVIPADHGLAMKTTHRPVFSHQLKRGKATEPHGTSPLYRPLCILYT